MAHEELRKFGPLPADHPLVGDTCAACRVNFVAGDEMTLVSLGPGDDSEEREKATAGRPYNSVAAPVHWACATGEV